jgi:hypothetical protein
MMRICGSLGNVQAAEIGTSMAMATVVCGMDSFLDVVILDCRLQQSIVVRAAIRHDFGAFVVHIYLWPNMEIAGPSSQFLGH